MDALDRQFVRPLIYPYYNLQPSETMDETQSIFRQNLLMELGGSESWPQQEILKSDKHYNTWLLN